VRGLRQQLRAQKHRQNGDYFSHPILLAILENIATAGQDIFND
jgi:hypothetical protein